MPKKEKTFSQGEVIFKQGEKAEFVYTIDDGKAELYIEINGKARVLGRKGEGDVLGANAVLEGTYDTCARAVTELTVFVQGAKEYIDELQKSGELSPSAGGKKQSVFDDDDEDDGEDLGGFNFSFGDEPQSDKKPSKTVARRTPSLVGRGRPASVIVRDDDDEPAKPNALVKVEKPKPVKDLTPKKPLVLPAEIKKFPVKEWLIEGVDETVAFGPVVLLAAIDGDNDGACRDSIYRVLRQVPNLQVKAVDKAIVDQNSKRGALQMRSWMTQHNADLGLYAELDQAGRVLQFRTVRPTAASDGSLTAGARFFLPVRMNAEQETLLKIFTVCAMTPTRLEHEQLLRLFLPVLLDQVYSYASKPIPELLPEEQAVDLTAFANVLSWVSLLNPAENRHAQASAIYEKALTLLPAYAPEYVFVNRQVGLLRQMEGEKKDDVNAFKAAEETFQKGLETVSERYQPEAYSDLKTRIGNVRQKIALYTGAGEDFVSSMTAYRDALKHLSPRQNTEKWAEAVNGLARTLQLFSSYSTKTTLLKKAVELYEKEMNELNRDESPLFWAKTCNNLAAALFLLSDREGTKPDLLRRAVEVFSDALRVYDRLGATEMADVAQKNLKKAEKVLQKTEKEFENTKNWLDDIIHDDYGDKASESAEKAVDTSLSADDQPLVFERIAVFEELDDDE